MDVVTITPPGYASPQRIAQVLLPGAEEKLARKEKLLKIAAANRNAERSPVSHMEWEQAKRSRDAAAKAVENYRSVLAQIGGA